MNEDTKLGATVHVALEQITGRVAAADYMPSDVLHEHEVSLIARLARDAAIARRRFVGWPTIIMESQVEPYHGRSVVLRAEVRTRPL